jgi:alkanesulfonate monooxygenase SsuD/methylene tetrahydromethanopterin reductase-like flavin-dependent oxidoreductase (luciferase family)
VSAAARPASFGWIMQPARFDTPPGLDPRDSSIARELIVENERHVALARAAGFDTVWVEDHMGWGEKAHLECFSHLAWLAGRHPELRYGTMVCGQAFRNPAYLGKLAVNLALLTGNRFILGIGAGNNGDEHRAYGYPFASAAQRVAQTEEAVRIIRALWTHSPATFHGKYYSIENAYSSPLPDEPVPLLIGGGGERLTLKLVAQHADWWCPDVGPVDVFARKAAILRDHCAAIGRDPRQIVHSQVVWINLNNASSHGAHFGDLHLVAGGPDDVTRELRAFRAAGVEHFQVRFMDFPSSSGMECFARDVLPRVT